MSGLSMKLLFVCLGNTCRSPMAESVMRKLVAKNQLDWEVDSAALRAWNVGYEPEQRCLKVLAENGLKSRHLGREIQDDDYHNFDYIFGMDDANITELTERKPGGSKAKIELLGIYNPSVEDRIIRDPYFVIVFRGLGMKVLFVCIGNTCRSPMAESVMRNLVENNQLDWEIDSAALRSWNVGYDPEQRCLKVLAENGLTSKHLGREIEDNDYHKFDYIFGMDESNIMELRERKPDGSKAKIELLGIYNPSEDDRIIRDPYFESGIAGFRRCYIQIDASCKNFLKQQLEK